jgi:hypothetical protein
VRGALAGGRGAQLGFLGRAPDVAVRFRHRLDVLDGRAELDRALALDAFAPLALGLFDGALALVFLELVAQGFQVGEVFQARHHVPSAQAGGQLISSASR